ncbi:Na+/H+ antiporter subunit E [Planctomycetota bacterium]|nr:Na+/H+ antiporter subunit E [Planctomycetota bacterium]
MLRHVFLFIVLYVFWIGLSGQVDYTQTSHQYLLGCGVASCLFGVWLANRVGFLKNEKNYLRIFVLQFPYILWLGGQILICNIDVAKRVWSLKPSENIDPHYLKFPYTIESDLALTIFCNSITLTPGTVTVKVDTANKEILIHALTKGAADGLQNMHDRVKKLEGTS